MVRIKRGVMHVKRRKHLLEYTKGFRHRRKSSIKAAREAMLHAGQYAFRDRRKKKGEQRKLWQVQINAAVRMHNLSYSKFINGLKKAKIELDRKVLAQLANEYPKVFAEIVKLVKTKSK